MTKVERGQIEALKDVLLIVDQIVNCCEKNIKHIEIHYGMDKEKVEALLEAGFKDIKVAYRLGQVSILDTLKTGIENTIRGIENEE